MAQLARYFELMVVRAARAKWSHLGWKWQEMVFDAIPYFLNETEIVEFKTPPLKNPHKQQSKMTSSITDSYIEVGMRKLIVLSK